MQTPTDDQLGAAPFSDQSPLALTAFVDFVRGRGAAVIATTAPDGTPQAALIGVSATEQGEVVFDTSASSRKFANLLARPRVALVIGWENETTLQLEGHAEVVPDDERARCFAAYVELYPEGAERARHADIVLMRVVPQWLRLSDFRPESLAIREGVPSWAPIRFA